ncbi:hypothetical protein [Peribacillus asahii]|uniref:hypothetical protein n=1 Tax=Peribacillus asahii TaxID=228899 RepID=UPI00382D5705
MKKLVIICVLLFMISGCGQKIPKPKDIIENVHSLFETRAEASAWKAMNEDFFVKTIVKEDNVYVECYVRGYSFSQTNSKKLATVTVSIDGKKHSERTTAAFVVRDVPNGKHRMKLEVLNEDGEKTGLTKEVEVHIESTI